MRRQAAFMVICRSTRIAELLTTVSRLANSRGRSALALRLPWQPGEAIEFGGRSLYVGFGGGSNSGDRSVWLELRLGGEALACRLSIVAGQHYTLIELDAGTSATADRFFVERERDKGLVDELGVYADLICFYDYGSPWELVYPPRRSFEVRWTLADRDAYSIHRPGLDPVIDIDEFALLLLELVPGHASPTHEQIAAFARADALPTLRLRIDDSIPAPMAGSKAVHGTWLGAQTLALTDPPACSRCSGRLRLAAQIDPGPVLGEDAGLWFLYLCDDCPDPESSARALGYWLSHLTRAELEHAEALVGEPAISRHVAGVRKFRGELGLSFAATEDFFADRFWRSNDGCPSADEEARYCEVVAALDPRATLADNGCFRGERVAQIGGYAELCDNISSIGLCPECKDRLFLLIAVPNQDRLWTTWAANIVVYAWVCLEHPDQSVLLITYTKFG